MAGKQQLPDAQTPHTKALRSHLQRLGWSMQTLANESGLDRQTVAGIMQGKNARLSTMYRFADALKVDVAELFPGPSPEPASADSHATNSLSDDAKWRLALVGAVVKFGARMVAADSREERTAMFNEMVLVVSGLE
jgi:transcriptional regulator with XRE-family HTH domain